MNRLYAVETMPTLDRRARRSSAAAAAERDRARSRAQLAAARRRRGSAGAGAGSSASADKWVAAVAKDLQAHRGASLVIAGDGQPPAVHALAHAMNQALGNVGQTVVYTEPVEAEPVDQLAVAARPRRRHERRQGRPAGDPRRQPGLHRAGRSDVRRRAGARCRSRVHLSLYDDETSALCHWQIPEAHFLEAWSDARALRRHGVDRPAADRAALRRQVGARGARGAAAIGPSARRTTSSASTGQRAAAGAPTTSTQRWRRWLHDGVIPDTAFAPQTVVAARVGARPDAPRRQPSAGDAASRSSSATIRRSSTAASRTTAGCRSCRSRSRS